MARRPSGERPDLVFLVADQDARRLIDGMVQRGQQPGRSCLGAFDWDTIAALTRDSVWRYAEVILRPFLGAKIVVCWDVAGSGAEERERAEVEASVVERLVASGHRQADVFALSFEPEVEIVLVPSWDRVCRLLARFRGVEAPTRARVLQKGRERHPRLHWPEAFDAALESHPKELFEELCHELSLPRTPAIYQQVASELSLPRLKESSAAARLAEALEGWFPAVGRS